MKPKAGTRLAKTKTFLKKTSGLLLLAVLLLAILPNTASAADYTFEEITFTFTTNASIYRVVQGDSVTINAHGSTSPVVNASQDFVNESGGIFYDVNGFYIANVGQGCTGGCGVENQSSVTTNNPFDLTLTVGGSNLPTVPGGQTVASRQILVYPVIDLSLGTDAKFFTGSVPITIEVYSSLAALTAAAQAVCTANPGQVGCNADGTVSNPNVGGSATSATPGILSGGGLGDALGATILKLVNLVLGAIVQILSAVLHFLANTIFIPLLVRTMTLQATDVAGSAILAGWTMVRDLVNMFFILVLIVIGFATILRIEAYNYRRLLVWLILMALLVNFSMVIARIILDITTVVQFSFLPVGDTAVQINNLYQKLIGESTWQMANAVNSFSSTATLGATISILFEFTLELGVVITFAAMAVLMLIRLIALWILIILSPFAYALNILPATTGYARQWWSTFIKYALFAPIMAFFLRLSFYIHENALAFTGAGAGGFTAYLQGLDALPNGPDFQTIIRLGLIYILILAFMWAGLVVTRQMGIFGANAIVGLAERGLKAPYGKYGLWGGTKAATSFGLRKAGKSMGVQLLPSEWVKGYKEYRKKKIAEDIQETGEKARARAAAGKMFTSFGSPEDFYRKALSFNEMKRFGKNLLAGRFNVNKAWKEDSEKAGQMRSAAGEMVTADDYRQKLNEEKALQTEQDENEEKKKQLDGAMGGTADTTIEDLKKTIEALIESQKKLAGEYAKAGDTEKAGSIRGEIAALQEQMKTNPSAVAYDKSSDVGAELFEILKQKRQATQLRQESIGHQLEDIGKFKEASKGKLVGSEQKAKAYEAAVDLEKKIESYRPPLTYEARLARNHLVADEKKKLTGIDNADELQSYLNDAVREGNRYRAMAVMEKMSEDYNDNEFLNNTHRTAPGRERETFTSNSEGMHQFRKEILQGKLHMDEQSALEFTSKLGYINESRGHTETSRLVGVRNGRQYAYTEPEHAKAALAEIAKKPSRSILSSLNRLGYGGETQDATGARHFNPSLLGKAILKGLGQALADSKQLDHMNPNAAGKLSGPVSIQAFLQAGVSPRVIEAIKKTASSAKDWDPSAVVDALEKRLKGNI